MSSYQGRKDFRAGRAALIISLLCTALFAIGAFMTHQAQGWNWVSLGLAGMTVLGLGAILEALVVRVQLTDEALLTTDLRGRRSYARKEITRVEEAKGVPTAIFLADGRVIKLPPAGSDIGNSIRAWLKHSA